MTALRLSWTICILICCLASKAQEPIFHPETMEIGLRITDFKLTRGVADVNQGTQRASYQGIGWELYGSKFISHHNFVRLGVGFSMVDAYRNFRIENDILYSLFTDESASRTLSYEIGFGHEFAKIQEPLLERFRFRAGATVTGSTSLLDKSGFSNTVYDSTNAVTQWRIVNKTKTGGQDLFLGLFAQAAMRVHKGFFVGVEWRVGPNLEFGGGKTKDESTDYTATNGTEYDSVTRTEGGLGLSWGHKLAAPNVFMSLAF